MKELRIECLYSGSEFITILEKNKIASRGEALIIGQMMINFGLVKHVTNGHGFRDGFFFYRFTVLSCGKYR